MPPQYKTIVVDGHASRLEGGSEHALLLTANWIHRRGIGSCYLRVPALRPVPPAAVVSLGPHRPSWRTMPATGAAAAWTQYEGTNVWGSVSVHTGIDVSRGPNDDTNIESASLTRRRCRTAKDESTTCGFDLVLTEPWRRNFETVMLLVVGALFSVAAELAMRQARPKSSARADG
jgi:hypothetical protein